MKTFQTETVDKVEEVKEKLKDEADFLSAFTKRVKKQMQARMLDNTRNTQPQRPAQQAAEPQGAKGTEGEEPGPMGKELKLPSRVFMNQPALAPSAISAHVPGVQFADFTFLNSDQSPYYAFYNRIGEQIRNRWVELLREFSASMTPQELEYMGKRDRVTMIEIMLDPNGDFHSSVLHHSSGVKQLDWAALEPFRMATPFVNPPKGMIEADGLIHIYFRATVLFRPPLGQALSN